MTQLRSIVYCMFLHLDMYLGVSVPMVGLSWQHGFKLPFATAIVVVSIMLSHNFPHHSTIATTTAILNHGWQIQGVPYHVMSQANQNRSHYSNIRYMSHYWDRVLKVIHFEKEKKKKKKQEKKSLMLSVEGDGLYYMA